MKQVKMPLEIEIIIETSDPVYTFEEVMDNLDLSKYFESEAKSTGRPKYDSSKLLKIILFSFMENGYSSLRDIEKLCKTDIRYMWLLGDDPAPSYATVCNFINKKLIRKVDEILKDINGYIFKKSNVNTSELYIDGTKIEANANKYTWVWKKACITSRKNLNVKINALLEELNEELKPLSLSFAIREEYSVEYMEHITNEYGRLMNVEKKKLPKGKGHHKSHEERIYVKLDEYTERLKSYAVKIEICGDKRNSYSKTDRDATFMRVKRDYMGNEQLLPAYNMQIGVCSEYIAVVDSQQYAADMDCFVPIMEKYRNMYGKYPENAVADAGYGSFNNYLYCNEHGIGKYIKYPMLHKEKTDRKYREDPYRAVNFITDNSGNMICPNGKKMIHKEDRAVKGNKYGRTEEIYECEDCSGCIYKSQCTRAVGNRVVRINRELSSLHAEVRDALESEEGREYLKQRAIQAEGVFGSVKWNRNYKRAYRRGNISINAEFSLLACGFNLYKYHNKKNLGMINLSA